MCRSRLSESNRQRARGWGLVGNYEEENQRRRGVDLGCQTRSKREGQGRNGERADGGRGEIGDRAGEAFPVINTNQYHFRVLGTSRVDLLFGFRFFICLLLFSIFVRLFVYYYLFLIQSRTERHFGTVFRYLMRSRRHIPGLFQHSVVETHRKR
jgi:hypothetical protein